MPRIVEVDKDDKVVCADVEDGQPGAKKPKRASQFTSRSFVFTCNMKSQEVSLDVFKDGMTSPTVRYVIVALQEGGETKTRHWQGYVEFTKPVKIGFWQKIVGMKCDCRGRLGTRDQARAYVKDDPKNTTLKKDDGTPAVYEFGRWQGGQGVTNNMPQIQELAKDGKVDQAYEEYFAEMMRIGKNVEAYAERVAKQRTEQTECWWIFGPSASGKTHVAVVLAEYMGEDEVYWKPQGKWWPGYRRQPLVIFNEFKADEGIDGLGMLALIDHVPHTVDVKNGHAKFNSPMIVVTSNLAYEDFYFGFPRGDRRHLSEEQEEAMEQRIDLSYAAYSGLYKHGRNNKRKRQR